MIHARSEKYTIHKRGMCVDTNARARTSVPLRNPDVMPRRRPRPKRRLRGLDKIDSKPGEQNMASNKTLVPEAKNALEQFKMEAAGEVGVTLNQGDNGNLTSRQAGSIGGQMVKKMIEKYENEMKTK
jgi:small acid-soluble spore protein D (minor alpha/beta-type SASP)